MTKFTSAVVDMMDEWFKEHELLLRRDYKIFRSKIAALVLK